MTNRKFDEVGVDPETLPDDVVRPSKARAGRTGPGRSDSAPGWKSTASEEMEKFRKVPLIGHLPWRAQYILFFTILFLSLPSLIYFSFSSSMGGGVSTSSAVAVHVSLNELSALYDRAASGTAIDPGTVDRLIKKVDATIPGQQRADWSQAKALVSTLPAQSADAKAILEAARLSHERLSQGLTATAPKWRAAGESGEWMSVEAVNLAQVLADMQSLSDASLAVSEGRARVPDRFGSARQNIEQALRVFASSPVSRDQTKLSDAWRSAAQSFTSAKPFLDGVIGRQKSWNAFLGAQDVFDAQSESLHGGVSAQTSEAPSEMKWAIIASALSAFVSLIFIGWIGWKQQKWHAIQARLATEKLEFDVTDLGRQAKSLSAGDLTVVLRSSNQLIKPLSDSLMATLAGLKDMVTDTTESAQDAANAANAAITTAGDLIDVSRSQINTLSETGRDILSLAETIHDVSEKSKLLSETSSETLTAVVTGQQAIEEARERIQAIREKSGEGVSRSRRLKKSSNEILFAITLLNDVAEQISVLSMQASLQAAKAGETGAGFRVVADGLKELSERSSAGARRVAALIETNLSDVDALLEALDSVTVETDEGSRLSDVSMESALILGERLNQLSELTADIFAVITRQESVAQGLDVKTKSSLATLESSSDTAQRAADSALALVEAVRGLERSAQKFKVKDVQ